MIKSYRVGEKLVCRNELLAEIIAYRKYDDVDVLLEDGRFFEHVPYNRFYQGHFYKPGYKYVRWPMTIRKGSLSRKYIGMKKRTIYGYRVLLAVNADGTIDYEDDDGSIIKNGQYFDFRYTNQILFKNKTREGKIITTVQ